MFTKKFDHFFEATKYNTDMTDSKKPIDFFVKLTETHPFISVLQYAGQDFVGIVQNRDDLVTTIYDYGAIVDAEKRLKFLELGDVWWWESNRQIPIHLFLKSEWSMFKPFLRTFNNKSQW